MKLTGRHYGIIAAGLVTAFLHLAAAFDRSLFPDGPDMLFVLNGIGYLGLLGAFFLPVPILQERHKLARWGLFVFAAITILAWLVIWVGFYVIRDGNPFFSHDSVYGVPAKIAELTLLALLWSDRP